MNNAHSLASIILFVAAIAGMAAMFLYANRKLADEKGLTPLFSRFCGGIERGGHPARSIGTNLPAWRVALYDDFMVVNIFAPKRLDYTQIASMKLSHWRLELKQKESSTRYIFWISSRRHLEKMITILRSKGVRADD